MRTLAITQNITVDGSIEMLGDWFDAQAQGDDSDLLEHSRREGDGADALLVGRRTFEDLRGYWPEQSDDPTGITGYLNGVDKYVVSGCSATRWCRAAAAGCSRTGTRCPGWRCSRPPRSAAAPPTPATPRPDPAARPR